jgi:hypothetical protein
MLCPQLQGKYATDVTELVQAHVFFSPQTILLEFFYQMAKNIFIVMTHFFVQRAIPLIQAIF